MSASSINRFALGALPVSPWKNGGGTTREIVRMPADAALDAFDWRVSIAELSANGAFSAFPGVDRIIALLDGAGVHMQSSDRSVDHRLDAPLQPFAFRGEESIDATLLGGTSCDFNVMTRRATTSGTMHVIDNATMTPTAAAGLFFAARGRWHIDARDELDETIEARAGIWWSDRALAWNVRPIDRDATMIVVAIEQRLSDEA